MRSLLLVPVAVAVSPSAPAAIALYTALRIACLGAMVVSAVYASGYNAARRTAR